MLLLAAASVAGTVWMVVVSRGTWSNRAYMGTDTRLAEMAVGALAAALVGHNFRVRGRAGRLLRRGAPYLMPVILAAWITIPIKSSLLYRGGLTVHAVLVSIVLMAAVQRTGTVRRYMSWRPFVRLGEISYAAYLVHWPIMLWMTPTRLGISPEVALVLQFTASIGIGIASAKYLEMPLRQQRRLPGRHAVPVAACAALVIALAATLMPGPDRGGMVARGATPELVVPTTAVRPTSSGVAARRAAPTTSVAGGGATPTPTTAPPTTLRQCGQAWNPSTAFSPSTTCIATSRPWCDRRSRRRGATR